MELLRLHCHIDEGDSDDDAILTLYSWAAIRQGEFESNRVWLDSGWTGKMDSFPVGPIEIPKSPCTAISSITYTAGDGTESAFYEYSFSPSSLQWDGGNPYARVYPQSSGWQEGSGVTLTFRAGWSSALFPQDLTQWILVKVAAKFEQREDLASATRKIAIPFPRHFADSLLDAWYLPK